MNEKDLINKYNLLKEKAEKLEKQNALDYLNSLSNKELFIFIAGKTYKYGRSFKDSLENAESHLKNRKKAIELFSKKGKD